MDLYLTESFDISSRPHLTVEECHRRALSLLEWSDREKEDGGTGPDAGAADAAPPPPPASAPPPVSARKRNVQVVRTIAARARKERKEAVIAAITPATGVAPPKDEAADAYLRHAADAGFAPSLVVLGNQCLEKANAEEAPGADGHGTERLVLEALGHYVKSDEGAGLFNAGHLLWDGHAAGALASDRAGAMTLFLRAASMGDPDAQYFVGVMYIGEGATEDWQRHVGDVVTRRRRGLGLLKRAASSGHEKALYFLALLHLEGDGELGVAPSVDTFRSYLDEAAQGLDADALFLRGRCHLPPHDASAGDGAQEDDGSNQGYVGGVYPEDPAEALRHFELATGVGSDRAAVAAGAMLRSSQYRGVVPDERRSFEMYQMAAEMGSIEGWRNVAACYHSGLGVPKCEKTADYIMKTVLDG